MDSSDSPQDFRIPKLGSNNFLRWKDLLLLSAEAKGFAQFITEKKELAGAATAPESEKHTKLRAAATYAIISSVDASNYVHV